MNTTSTAFVVSATMLMVLAGNDAVHAAPTPTETVTNAIVKVMQILNDPLLMEAGMSEARRGEIENVVRASISYEEMARRSLGITWRDLNESERSEERRVGKEWRYRGGASRKK